MSPLVNILDGGIMKNNVEFITKVYWALKGYEPLDIDDASEMFIHNNLKVYASQVWSLMSLGLINTNIAKLVEIANAANSNIYFQDLYEMDKFSKLLDEEHEQKQFVSIIIKENNRFL